MMRLQPEPGVAAGGYVLVLGSEMFVHMCDEDRSSCVRQMGVGSPVTLQCLLAQTVFVLQT